MGHDLGGTLLAAALAYLAAGGEANRNRQLRPRSSISRSRANWGAASTRRSA
ncbi:MAG: hypothetical protein U1E38_04380 [Rhodospirillales bacterium]